MPRDVFRLQQWSQLAANAPADISKFWHQHEVCRDSAAAFAACKRSCQADAATQECERQDVLTLLGRVKVGRKA